MTSTIKKDEIQIYLDKTNTTTFNIPLSFLRQRHGYGMALVGAWRSLYGLFYLTDTPEITQICGPKIDATVTENSGIITLNFTVTIWDGISVLPL